MDIIEVKNLSKKYRISHHEAKSAYGTLSEEIINFVKKPARWLSGHRDFTEDIWAVKDVSFSVKPGEILGVIGPNGAGKSTLLKILTRITPPSSGKAIIKGRVSSLLEVGVGFHPELTGRDNIYLNGAILGMTKKEISKKFNEIVDFAGVEKFLDTPVKKYSSGMYVRLAFSVAAHLEPEILLVDEVLAVGDAAFQNKSMGKMREVSQGGRTVLLVSHNMGTIQQLTKRCLLLNEGRLVADDKTITVVEQYMKSSLSSGTSKTFEPKTEIEGLYIDSMKLDKDYLQHGFNKPLKFDINFRSKNNLKDLLVVFHITNSFGAKIMALKTIVPEINLGQSIVSIVSENHYLPPGLYNLDTTILFCGNCIFSKEGIVSFELSDVGVEDWFMVRSKDIFGSFPPVKNYIQNINKINY